MRLLKYVGNSPLNFNDYIPSKDFESYQMCDFCHKVEKGNAFWTKKEQHICLDCYSKGKRIKTDEEMRLEKVEAFAREHSLSIEQAELIIGKVKSKKNYRSNSPLTTMKKRLVAKISAKLLTEKNLPRGEALREAHKIVSNMQQTDIENYKF